MNMKNENKNPIPFNPQQNLLGWQSRDALDSLRDIFINLENGGDAESVSDIVYMKYVELQRRFK